MRFWTSQSNCVVAALSAMMNAAMVRMISHAGIVGYSPRIDCTNRQYFDQLRRACLLLPWHLLGLEVSGRRVSLHLTASAGRAQRRPDAWPTTVGPTPKRQRTHSSSLAELVFDLSWSFVPVSHTRLTRLGVGPTLANFWIRVLALPPGNQLRLARLGEGGHYRQFSNLGFRPRHDNQNLDSHF